MIAADTCSMIAFLGGENGADVDAVIEALSRRDLYLPPVVVSELLSDHRMTKSVRETILEQPLLPLSDGYWERVGSARAYLLSHKYKARLADALVACAAIDAKVSLITRDGDYRHYAKHFGLKLVG